MNDPHTSHPTSRPIGAWENLAIASATLGLLTFVSPQVGVVGHGLRTLLPALTIAFFAILKCSPNAFVRAFWRYRAVYLLSAVFLLQASIRFLFVTKDPEALWHTFFVSPIINLVILILTAALAELGDAVIHRFKCWLLFGWCLSFALSLPILIKYPGIARLTMGNPQEIANTAKWAPLGVAEYSGYTTIGICLAPLFGVMRKMEGPAKWFAFPLILMTIAAVLVSTFTMASTMVVLSVSCMIIIWVMAGQGASRMLRLSVVVLSMTMLPALYTFGNSLEQTKFIVSKVERLTSGVSNKGLSKGDDTMRGAWFMDEMGTFADEPFLGYIPGVTGQRGHGHSSLSNSLVLFGIFGTLTWVLAMVLVFRITMNHTPDPFDRQLLVIGWVVFILSGILNPIWYASTTLAALFALTQPVGDPHGHPVSFRREPAGSAYREAL